MDGTLFAPSPFAQLKVMSVAMTVGDGAVVCGMCRTIRKPLSLDKREALAGDR